MCGSGQAEPIAAAQNPATPAWGAPPPVTEYYQPVMPNSPAKELVRQIAASPLFLAAVITVSVQMLAQIISIFMPTDIMSMLNSVLRMLDAIEPGMGSYMYSELHEVVGALNSTQVVGSITSLIFPALSLTALWMIFASAKRFDGPKTSGFTILHVLQVFGVIGACFGVLGFVFVAVVIIVLLASLANQFSYSGAGYGTDTTALTVLAVVVLVIGLALVVLSLVYEIKVLGSISRAKKAITTGIIVKPASKLITVFCFICAVAAIPGIFADLFTGNFMASLVSLGGAVANVLFALVVMKFNKAVKQMNAQTQPMPFMNGQY